MRVGSRSSRASASRSSSVPSTPEPAEPRQHRRRVRPDVREVVGERHAGPLLDERPPRPRSRSSSRCAARRAARSAGRGRTAARTRARAGAGSVDPGGPAGSSRSTIPSSAATSIATADRELRHRRPRGTAGARHRRCPRPRRSRQPPRARTATPRPGAVHPRTARLASTWSRQLISSGAAFEERVGYSRAVRIGDRVWVSGTAPIMPDDADPPDDAVRPGEGLPRDHRARARRRRARASTTSSAHGSTSPTRRSSTTSAVRTARRSRRARPATTGIVTQLLDPRWLVEIEAEAVILPS